MILRCFLIWFFYVGEHALAYKPNFQFPVITDKSKSIPRATATHPPSPRLTDYTLGSQHSHHLHLQRQYTEEKTQIPNHEGQISTKSQQSKHTQRPANKQLNAAVHKLENVRSFSEIQSQGVKNACYVDEQHYLAEYLYQHPSACMWHVDNETNTIATIPIPLVPADAIALPPPSGQDDTQVLQNLINSNAGRTVFGNGTYQVNGLKIRVPIDIFDMPMVLNEEATNAVTINSPDVRIFRSPIDAQHSDSATTGYHVKEGSHRFVLVESGFSNVHHRNGQNAAGVLIQGVNNFHIACNTFNSIINETSDNTKTARANAIWMSGNKNQSSSGGVIANNTSTELQSNGKLFDAEFFTIQNYKSTDVQNPVRIFANRGINAGKRLAKLQESNALVLSNHYEWRDKSGPLGNRLLFAMINVQFSNNVIARNNRLKVAADGRFDYIFHTNAKLPDVVQENIHFDCNDIEIQNELDPKHGNVSKLITARNDSLSDDVTGKEAINSSANYNRVYGAGSVSFHYWFGPGYDPSGQNFEAIGNDISVPYIIKEYKDR